MKLEKESPAGDSGANELRLLVMMTYSAIITCCQQASFLPLAPFVSNAAAEHRPECKI
jgi:hypothetical protein